MDALIKKQLIKSINQLNEHSPELAYIRHLIETYIASDSYSKNNNGIFISINDIPASVLYRIRDYLLKCEFDKTTKSLAVKVEGHIIENDRTCIKEELPIIVKKRKASSKKFADIDKLASPYNLEQVKIRVNTLMKNPKPFPFNIPDTPPLETEPDS